MHFSILPLERMNVKMNKDYEKTEDQDKEKGRGWISTIIRFVVAAVVLMVTSFLTPGFENLSFGTAILAALVIAGIDYLVQTLFKIDASPFGRGISGFLISALIIYLTQFIVPDMEINILGALVASLIIGIIDAVIPTHVV